MRIRGKRELGRTYDKQEGEENIPIKKSAGEKIDDVFKIPEQRISEDCIKAVAKQMGISEDVARKVHDFQWFEVKKASDEMKLIHVSKFFKLKFFEKTSLTYIKAMEKELEDLNQKYEYTPVKKRKEYIEEKRQELRDKINTLQTQLSKSIQKKKKI